MSVRECAAATRSFQHLRNFKSAAKRDLLGKLPVTYVAFHSFDVEVRAATKSEPISGD